ncbi:DUF427 domain-containing protein [Arthrobacter sp. B0490]|uniref:DUF427 domain-containing protein n=1 Tax=Arthrobacter sp. B0490 TaxID=2058891 RepID=UPI000CE570D3|nr:DUF427 domain-containing protein [Arthrobacter sp. B0490]
MPKAVWKGRIVAESAHTVLVDGNHYFPPDSIAQEYFVPSEKHTVCSWKGTAGYYSLEIDGERNADAAWIYPDPKEAAENIRGHYAFWKGVTVSD